MFFLLLCACLNINIDHRQPRNSKPHFNNIKQTFNCRIELKVREVAVDRININELANSFPPYLKIIHYLHCKIVPSQLYLIEVLLFFVLNYFQSWSTLYYSSDKLKGAETRHSHITAQTQFKLITHFAVENILRLTMEKFPNVPELVEVKSNYWCHVCNFQRKR